MSEIVQNHEGSGDNIARDKLAIEAAIILSEIFYNNPVSNFHYHGDKISEKDDELFSKNVHLDKVKHLKNLLDKIQFHCDLGEYTYAKDCVNEATVFWHNYPELLLYNALCTFATSDISELIFTNNLTNKIRKLVEEAKELRGSNLYDSITQKISEEFYLLIEKNIFKLNSESLQGDKKMDYYRYAMVCHITRLEFCYEILPNIKYLKKCVEYLSGNDKFAWLTIDQNNMPIDLNQDFYKEGILKKRESLIAKIRIIEPTYQSPDLWFGKYYSKPEKKESYINTQTNRIYFYKIIVFLIIPFLGLILWISNTFDFKIFIEFLIIFVPLIIIVYPFGEFRLSILDMITRSVHKWLAK